MNKKAQISIQKVLIFLVIIILVVAIFYFVILNPIIFPEEINLSKNYSAASPYYSLKESNNYTIIYPNLKLTPGEVGTNNLSIICEEYYTKLLVMVPEDIVNQVYAEYNITTHANHEYEIDHWIPLALGGSNNLPNLWPQPKVYPGYREKDYVQLRLRDQLCSGKISLEEARAKVQGDWFDLYIQLRGEERD